MTEGAKNQNKPVIKKQQQKKKVNKKSKPIGKSSQLKMTHHFKKTTLELKIKECAESGKMNSRITIKENIRKHKESLIKTKSEIEKARIPTLKTANREIKIAYGANNFKNCADKGRR